MNGNSHSLPATLIYACSGAADVGAIADQAARRLAKDGIGKMSCLAGVGGRVPALMESAQKAARILAIDGCDQACARSCLELAGFAGFVHLTFTDLGMPKGESAPSPERVGTVVDRARQAIGS